MTVQTAIEASFAECERFFDPQTPAAHGCVLIRTYTTVGAPRISGDTLSEWTCVASESNCGLTQQACRLWISSGPTPKIARENAVKGCNNEGGHACLPDRCFNSDRDKIH